MKSILVTGSGGFVGQNLCVVLGRRDDTRLLTFDLADDPGCLEDRVLQADFIFHLAGVNRPVKTEDFEPGNAGLTGTILELLRKAGRATPLLLSSSTQAALENPYGLSKRAAENLVFAYGRDCGAEVFVYRFPNLFGKWCRPNYNSAVATFCHNIARGLPIHLNDPASPIRLVYIDDLLSEALRALEGRPTRSGEFCEVPISHKVTIGQIADLVSSFRESRENLSFPDLSDPFTLKLYSTYLSYLPEGDFGYPLKMHCDPRGSFTEFQRTPDRGQISINISKPGITRGNHWHHTKTEKFLVVSGQGVIRFRRLGTLKVIEYPVCGDRLEVIDIPPGYTHNISNIGDTELVTVMWANEPYDPSRPDTWFEEV
ncbi:NAD-dependent epimerase/dehydratase family protein [Geothrix oryzisoli]|uniref:polysaccharide biosynthesis C-terminal domain-containing protein n=1 Tax=Geothrix oryzisoli TaxID=2922721 RepID=UPI001FACDC9A|nr:NAD-dependent epimerase/dehydratase family protein [Geothrix oryzisoli]